MLKWLAFFLCIQISASAAITEDQLKSTLENRYVCSSQTTPYALTPKVDVATGTYMEDGVDLSIATVEPLSFHRFFYSNSPYDSRFGNWNYIPESHAVATFEIPSPNCFVACGDSDGSFQSFENRDATVTPQLISGSLKFDTSKQKNVAVSNGQTHPLNTEITFKRKNEAMFIYEGQIKDGSGRIRYFSTPNHCWISDTVAPVTLTTIDYNGKKHNETLDFTFSPVFWTPFQLLINETRLPNGNVLVYEYMPWKNESIFPQYRRLSTIKAFNSTKSKQLTTLTIDYDKQIVTGSDNREAKFTFSPGKPCLLTAQNPSLPKLSYQYEGTNLASISKPKGTILKTDYYPDGKVKQQLAPLGPKGELYPISQYIYGPNTTEVIDAENHKKAYIFDENKRIRVIHFIGHHTEHYKWNDKGNLEDTGITDEQGKIVYGQSFRYDENHNPIYESMSDTKEVYILKRTFSKDGFNLKEKEFDGYGKEIRYGYKPQTNLLTSELTYNQDKICKRIFHNYDDCAVLIKTIVDDGSNIDPNDLKNVTYRRITEITPKKENPCLGLPETVEEKTIDSSGNEILLSKIVYTYHPSGKVQQEDHYDANNSFRYSISHEYDSSERLKKTVNPLGHATTFVYDENFNLTSSQGPRSRKEWEYDKADRPITEKTNNLSLRKKYNRLGQVIEVIDECQNSTLYTYDIAGNIIRVTFPDGGIQKREYDVLGNCIKETDPNGYETKKKYNFRKQITHISHPDNTEEFFSYTLDGFLKEHTDKNGVRTVYTTDVFGNPLKTETYTNNLLLKATSATYSPFCKLSETDPEGIVTKFTYDFAGRKTAERKKDRESLFFYDELGNLARTQTNDAVFIEEFDLLSRLIEKRTEDLSGNILFKENYIYDEDGNRTHVITCEGITVTTYNKNNLPVSITTPDGHTTEFSYSYDKYFTKTTVDPTGVQTIEKYDPCKRLSSIKILNKQGHVIQHREFVYDPAGNRLQAIEHVYEGITPSQTITTRWEYGPHGRVEKQTESDQKITSYLYDDKGRLKTIVKPDGVELHHLYDDLGRLLRLRSTDVNYTYSYDKNDHILAINGLTRTYDVYGNLIEEKLENGQIVKNTYDPFGKRKSITANQTTANYTYQANQLHTVTCNDLTYTYKTRNLAGKPTEITFLKNTLNLSYDTCLRPNEIRSPYFTARNYKYDAKGNLSSYLFVDSIGTQNQDFIYDDLSQLISENSHSYSYDSLYNRVILDKTRLTLNDLSQLTNDGTKEYVYDANGNLIQAGETLFSYDALNRLTKVTKDNKTTEYTYDGLNRRITKKTPNKTIHFIWDDKNEIGSTNGELRILGEGMGAEIGAACFLILNKQTYVPIHDHRGCVVTLVNYKSKPVESYRYSAFGEELTTNKLSPWRFLSKRTDEETGFVYFGRRYYSAQLGRWITPDPLGFEDGPNLYAYVHNNPLLAIDLYGEWSLNSFGRSAFDFAFPCASALYKLPSNAPLWKRGALAFGAVGEAALLFAPPAKFGMSLAEKTVTQIGKYAAARETERQMMRSAGKTAAIEKKIFQSTEQNLNGVYKTSIQAEKTIKPTTEFLGGVTVFSRGKVIAEGTVDLRPTLNRLNKGHSLPHRNDGSIFSNFENLLPTQPRGYYKEYVHPTPGVHHTGPQRIVVGQKGEMYYSPDHYKTFIKIKE